MRRRFLGGAFLLLLMEVLALASDISLAGTESQTIIVPDDFPTIQDAINNAVDGDTVFVKVGIYYEHIVVNKTVSLVGEDVSATIIDGNNTGTVVSIVSDYVNATGFTVQKSGNVSMPALDAGFCLNGSTGCTISENRVIDNGFCGISLLNSQQNTVTRNDVTSNTWTGVHLLTSSHNTISRNVLHDNTGAGINGHAASHYNNISENVISNSTRGMFYHNANYNNICRNNISIIAIEGIWLQDRVNYNVVAENNLSNITVAIRLQGPNYYNLIFQNNISQNGYGFHVDAYARSNTIWGNNIIDNDQQVYLSTGFVNNWHGGYPAGGNYWSDYNGNDTFCGPNQDLPGIDGKGDTPYVIDASNQDKYPLMDPYEGLDVTPPQFANWTQNPQGDEIQPGASVTVTIDVMDKSGVESVTLLYKHNSTGSWSGWIEISMNLTTGNIYEATISSFQDGTTVEYCINSTDFFDNWGVMPEEGYSYIYHVIPEFNPSVPLVMFLLLAFAVITLTKKSRLRLRHHCLSSLFLLWNWQFG